MPTSGFATRRPQLPCQVWAINDVIGKGEWCSVAWFRADGSKIASNAYEVLFCTFLRAKSLAVNGHASIKNVCYAHGQALEMESTE